MYLVNVGDREPHTIYTSHTYRYIKADNSPHKLLAPIVVAPNSHEKDLKLNSDYYGIAIDYEIEYEGHNALESFSGNLEVSQPELIGIPFELSNDK
ncbi:hypothetical protein [Paraliobacillus zengyii]|uniref:hypothetical protein n=1 Tax=Paraliobacillus zengyii TaxID=2213194 RepID=UPI000DD45EF8|nr:hypothetical protein [Paraliobacillus zengyii]